MSTLTRERQVSLFYAATHQCRRKAKRYLKDHGLPGSAEQLDKELAEIAERADFAAIRTEAAERAATAKANADRLTAALAADADRLRLKRKAYALASAAEGNWLDVARWFGDDLANDAQVDFYDGYFEPAEAEAVEKYGSDPSADDVAAILAERAEGEMTFDSADLDATYEELCGFVRSCTRDAMHECASMALRERAIKGGRYAVVEVEHKPSGAPLEVIEFDDRSDAEAYCALKAPGYKGSWGYLVVMNAEESHEEIEEVEEDDDDA